MASFNICSCLPKISGPAVKVVPVMFPPGRLRLATSPVSTGSLGTIMTIGMLLVALFAASAAEPAGATITSTLPNQVGRELGQSLDVPLRPSVLDDEVLA